jgi:uncharacterized protein (TIRG00374 family)
MKSTTKKVLKSSRFKFFLKLALVATLFYFLGQKGFISLEATQRAFEHWHSLLPAAICLFVTSLLGVIRWAILLRAQQIRVSLGRVFQLCFLGNFFNIALPGAVSGDVVKAIYVAQEVQGHRARAFSSILFDRFAGLMALVIVSVAALGVSHTAEMAFHIPLAFG